MYKWVFIFLLFSSALADIAKIPVLYEGRVRPFGTLPKNQQEIEKVLLAPLNEYGEWGTYDQILKMGCLYPEHHVEKIRLEKSGNTLAKALLEGYSTIEKKPFLYATDKTLFYPSSKQLTFELFLYQIPTKWILCSLYFLAGLFFFLKKSKLGIFFLIAVFCLHTLFLACKSYVLMRPPVSNMEETLLYVPWVAVLLSFIFRKRKFVLEGACIVSFILLYLLPSPSFEPLQAVLNSQYWLIIHVLMVVGSYGIFFLSGILGHIYLIQPKESLEKTIAQTLYIGTAFLICGTILGGIWAAESWGRFWDWDPKESWAFVASSVYLIWIHAYKFKKIQGKGLAIGAIVGLVVITFTWYGVNYILASGLHSYGFGSGGQIFYYLYVGAEAIFLCFSPIIKNFLYKNWMIEKKGRKK